MSDPLKNLHQQNGADFNRRLAASMENDAVSLVLGVIKFAGVIGGVWYLWDKFVK